MGKHRGACEAGRGCFETSLPTPLLLPNCIPGMPVPRIGQHDQRPKAACTADKPTAILSHSKDDGMSGSCRRAQAVGQLDDHRCGQQAARRPALIIATHQALSLAPTPARASTITAVVALLPDRSVATTWSVFGPSTSGIFAAKKLRLATCAVIPFTRTVACSEFTVPTTMSLTRPPTFTAAWLVTKLAPGVSMFRRGGVVSNVTCTLAVAVDRTGCVRDHCCKGVGAFEQGTCARTSGSRHYDRMHAIDDDRGLRVS